MAALDLGLGIAGIVLTGIPMLSDLFAPKPDDTITTNIRMIAGDADFADGDQPHVHLFDRSGNTIGFVEGSDKTINRGQPRDIKVEQIDPSKSANGAEYIAIAMNGLNNAICISILTVTTPTGVTFTWMGDIGFQCGAPWFYGNVLASVSEEFGEVRPRCVWVDGDATNDIKTQGLGIHLNSFTSNQGREADFNDHNDKMCKSDPRFKIYENLDFFDSIPFFKEPVFDEQTLVDIDDKALDQSNWDTKPFDLGSLIFGRSTQSKDQDKKIGTVKNNSTTANTHPSNSDLKQSTNGKNGTAMARPGKTRNGKKPWKEGQLVKSPRKEHSAMKLCGSKSSWGPDFISLSEKVFCDMDKKTTWPLCETTNQKSCFDVDANKMRLGPNNSRRDVNTGLRIPNKVYTDVKQW